MEKSIPTIGDDALVWYEDQYWSAIVFFVDSDKKVFTAMLLDTATQMENIHFCRFRPVC